MATGTAGLAAKLIEGAGAATEGPQEWVSTQNQQIYAQANQQMVESGGQMIATLVENKRKKEEAEKAQHLAEWDKLANAAIEDSQYMTEDEYKVLVDKLKEDRESFINASKEEKTVLLNNMETWRDEIENVKDFRTTLSSSAQDEDGIQGNANFLTSNLGLEYKDILSGNKSMIQQGDKYGYMMYDPSVQESRIAKLEQLETELLIATDSGEDTSSIKTEIETLTNEINQADIDPRADQVFKTVYDMEQTINHYSFDREVNNKAMEFATNAQTLGSQVPQGNAANFNYDSTYELVGKEIVDRGNIRSLMEDNHIGNKSWETSMIEALSKATYQDLGVDLTNMGMDAETLTDLDPTKDDGLITDADIDAIMIKLKGNADMTREYLTTYFTNFIQQNYQNGYDGRPKPSPIEVEFNGRNL
jgi:hypothetical protein